MRTRPNSRYVRDKETRTRKGKKIGEIWKKEFEGANSCLGFLAIGHGKVIIIIDIGAQKDVSSPRMERAGATSNARQTRKLPSRTSSADAIDYYYRSLFECQTPELPDAM